MTTLDLLTPFVTAGSPRALSAARELSTSIASAVRSVPGQASEDILVAEETEAAVAKAKTLTRARFALGQALYAFGFKRALLDQYWRNDWKFTDQLPAQLSSADDDLRPGELAAKLIVLRPGDAGYTPPPAPISAQLAAAPTVAPAAKASGVMTAGDRAVAERDSATARFDAEKAERFSQNWGAGRDARRLELVAKYSAMPAGPERVAFLQKHSNDLFAAARKIAGIKNHDQ
jgi:hypothetical protein